MNTNEKNELANNLLIEFVRQNGLMHVNVGNDSQLNLGLSKNIDIMKKAHDIISKEIENKF